MTVDADKLRELAASLSEDQRRLLREGLAGAENLDVPALAETLNSAENQRILSALAEDDGTVRAFAAPDGGAPDAGTTDAGVPDAGASTVPSEPPLTRW